MMSQLLERGGVEKQASDGKRIASTIGRMQRLIVEVFEKSRMKAGLGLGLTMVPGDMAAFVRALLEDAVLAHPETHVLTELPPTLDVDFDPDRMSSRVGLWLHTRPQQGTHNMVACATGRSPRVQPLWLVKEPSQAGRMHVLGRTAAHMQCNRDFFEFGGELKSAVLGQAHGVRQRRSEGIYDALPIVGSLDRLPRGPCVTAIAITDGKIDKMGKIKNFQDVS